MGELVILHKQLGDTVLLEPVLRKIAHLTGERVHLLCPPQWRSLIELMPHTLFATGKRRWMPDRLRALDSGGRTTRAAAFTFCREKLLLVPEPGWVTRTHRAVYSQIDAIAPGRRDMARWLWDAIGKDNGLKYEPPVLERPPEDWTRDGLCPAEPFVLLHPVTTSLTKACDPAQWAALLRVAHDLGLKRILVSGGMEAWHYEHCARIASATKELGVTIEDVSGMTVLPEFLHLLSRARLVLCVDGAASHLARAMNVSSLTLHAVGSVPEDDNPRHIHLAPGAANAAKALHELFTVTDAVPDTSISTAVPASLREGITGGLRNAPR